MQSFTRRFGEEAATEALNFSRAHVYALKKVVEEEGIDCEFELRRSYDVFVTMTKLKQLVSMCGLVKRLVGNGPMMWPWSKKSWSNR